MKIIEASEYKSFSVTTDGDEQFQYTRHRADNWTVVMGQSEEPVFDCEEIEALFQEYARKHDLEKIPCDGKFLAVTQTQHPLTGDPLPRVKEITRHTTVGSVVDWCKDGKDFNVSDLRIVQIKAMER